VVQFLRQTGHAIVRPEVLGLPLATGKTDSSIERAWGEMATALEAGDEEQFTRLVFNLYLGGHAVPEICDRAIAPAFHGIGTGWEHGRLEVYQERRACEICMRVLYQIRQALPSIEPGASQAIGGTLEGDPYTLPTAMVALVLRDMGWEAESYGSGHPAETLCAAIRDVRPRLFWLSVSPLPPVDEFLSKYSRVFDAAAAAGVAVVVGGRGLAEDIRREMQYSAYCDNLRHLASFARTLG
jgi:methanogenic corrinoid protein MtbC1